MQQYVQTPFYISGVDFYIDSGFLCNIENTCYDFIVLVLMNAKIFPCYNTLFMPKASYTLTFFPVL